MKSHTLLWSLILLSGITLGAGSGAGLPIDTIVVQPEDARLCEYAEKAVFVVGYPLPDVTFQWQSSENGLSGWESLTDNEAVEGSGNDTLMIHDVAGFGGFSFRCILRNTFTGVEVDTSDVASLILIGRPVVDFSYETPCFNATTGFKDLSSDPGGLPIVSWMWDFGDNAISYRQNPTHFFDGSGSYLVALTVWNDSNCINTATKEVEILPYNTILITGPEVVCSNEISNYAEKYYIMGPFNASRTYEWILPDDHEDYISNVLQINDSTLRVDWKSVETSRQVSIRVTESHPDWECETGNGQIDVLVTAQKAPGLGKVVPKKEGKPILLYLGPPVGVFQWGYTENAFDGDESNDKTVYNTDYTSNYCDFGNLDPDNSYWVETREDSRMECWTRTYYLPETATKLSSLIKIHPNPVNDFLQISSEPVTGSMQEITILTGTGTMVKHFISNTGLGDNQILDVSGFSSGLYLCRIVLSSGEVVFEKFLVNHNQ
jgi:PKD repeat protein